MGAGRERIRVDDGVVVWGWLLFETSSGLWFGYSEGRTMSANSLGDLLARITDVTGHTGEDAAVLFAKSVMKARTRRRLNRLYESRREQRREPG